MYGHHHSTGVSFSLPRQRLEPSVATYNVVDKRLLDLEQLLVHLCNLLLSARSQEGALGPHATSKKGATPFANLLM